jgi:hypothetical protein
MNVFDELRALNEKTGMILALCPNTRCNDDGKAFDSWDVVDLLQDTYESGVVAWAKTPELAVSKARAKLKKEVSIPNV